jgi:hypothetical protein
MKKYGLLILLISSSSVFAMSYTAVRDCLQRAHSATGSAAGLGDIVLRSKNSAYLVNPGRLIFVKDASKLVSGKGGGYTLVSPQGMKSGVIVSASGGITYTAGVDAHAPLLNYVVSSAPESELMPIVAEEVKALVAKSHAKPAAIKDIVDSCSRIQGISAQWPAEWNDIKVPSNQKPDSKDDVFDGSATW